MVSKYFSMAEVTHTNQPINNTMNEINLYEVGYLCTSVLDPIREHFNAPLICSSIFRSEALNKAVGGSKSSQHLASIVGGGAAADITSCGTHSLMDIFEYIKDNLEFDQLITENCTAFNAPETMKWLHVSKRMKGNRKQILVMVKGKYQAYQL